jgi:hypothetical protein
MYRIVLGNGQKEYFSSEKKAKRYLAEINRNLNSRLHELNQVYALITQEYRNKWFYFDIVTIENVNSKMNSIDKAMLKLIIPRSGPNFNYYVFTDISIIVKNLTDIINIIQKASLADGTYTEVHRITFLDSWIKRINNDILNYKPDVNDIINDDSIVNKIRELQS